MTDTNRVPNSVLEETVLYATTPLYADMARELLACRRSEVAPASRIEDSVDRLRAVLTPPPASRADADLRAAITEAEACLDGEPDYHDQGMGCGLEDRNITDRYEAMRYGWEEAMERVYAEHIIPARAALSTPAPSRPDDEPRHE